MQLIGIIEDGMIVVTDKSEELLETLESGKYIISVRPFVPKTQRQYLEQYFSMVDEAVMHTGNDRYTIHAEFKNHAGIGSTKELTTNEDWLNFIDKFKWWSLSKFDNI